MYTVRIFLFYLFVYLLQYHPASLTLCFHTYFNLRRVNSQNKDKLRSCNRYNQVEPNLGVLSFQISEKIYKLQTIQQR